MFIELVLGILAGVLCGVFTGLAPGIHVNLITAVLMGLSSSLVPLFGHEPLIAFIISLSITHTFLDVIPSIFLGAPEGANILGVLPGHRLLLEGKGLEAVKLTLIGSGLGLIISCIFYIIIEQILKIGYPFISDYIAELLLITGIFIIMSNQKKFRAFFVYASSGLLGYIGLNSRLDNSLFPLLTGFFGLSTLIFSLSQKSSLPPQEFTETTDMDKKQGFFSAILGTISGFITAILPGIGSSTAASMCSLIKKDKDARNFLIMIGAISTVNFFMSIAALNVMGKARNGAIIAVMHISEHPSVLLLISAALISGGLSWLIGLRLSKWFLKIMVKLDYSSLAKATILVLAVMAFILSGYKGLLILFSATAIGLYSNFLNISRNTMMSCIMVPVMIYFI